MEIPSLFRESRYGMPPADQILSNRQYIIGYSYLFRQPRWAMHVVDSSDVDAEVDREDAFRTDFRVPEIFQVELKDYKASGYDRGHLVPSADRAESRVENSETFLLTNMAPQTKELNRGIWKGLEAKARELASHQDVVEVYSISGPYFLWNQPLEKIGEDVVVPHGFFKSLLVESNRGKIAFLSWMIPNLHEDLGDATNYACTVREIELATGLPLWDRLKGERIEQARCR